jgi:hypothetical protein
MFRNILLPLDLTDRHQQALDVSAELAGRGAAAITLLHVIETIAGLSPSEEKDFYGRLERVARSHLDRWRKDLEKRQVSCQTEIYATDTGLPNVFDMRWRKASISSS